MTTPTAYVVEERRQHCIQCGHSYSFTSLYAKHPAAANASRLKPITRPSDIEWNIPIEHNYRPLERIPFCHECHHKTVLGHLRKPAAAATIPTGAFARKVDEATTVHGGYAVTPDSPLAHAPKPKKAKVVYTVDDLL